METDARPRGPARASTGRGVGRPDLSGADHGWVVDVDHAPAGILCTLPGIDEETARRVVATREELGPFSSVDDLAFVLDLPADRIRRLRELAVALPDRAARHDRTGGAPGPATMDGACPPRAPCRSRRSSASRSA